MPLIGFAGAPFTLASYLVEGGRSSDYALTKTLMWSEPRLWEALVERLATIALASLRDQVSAGASAVQIFESWGGALSPADYRRYVLPALQLVLDGLEPLGVPRIVFGVGTGELLGLFAEAGADVVGVDWRVPLDVARARVGPAPPFRGTSTPRLAWPPGPCSPTRPGRCWHWRAGGATCSTSATASSLPRTPTSSLDWSTSCTWRRRGHEVCRRRRRHCRAGRGLGAIRGCRSAGRSNCLRARPAGWEAPDDAVPRPARRRRS